MRIAKVILGLSALIAGFVLCFQVIYRLLLFLNYTETLPHTRNKWIVISYIARDALKYTIIVMLAVWALIVWLTRKGK